MAFKSLLLSKDADLVQTLSRLLKDLEIAVEPCSEPFAAAKRLMDQHFDAILVDCEDEQGAGWVLQSARMATASKKSVTIAIVGAQSAGRGGPRAGENFVIQKPIVLKQVESTLRAARGLMGDGGVVPRIEPPVSGSGVLAEKPPVLAPAAAPHVAATGQGRPPAELFDELTAALDRLGPQGAPPLAAPVASASSGAAAAPAPAWEKPERVASFSSGAAAAAAPAWEKSAPPAAEPPSSRPEALVPPVLRPAQQAWPGLASPPSAPSRPEVPAVLPLGATSAEMKPSVRPAQDQVRSNNALDDVRRRMGAPAPPTWRTDVEERQEAPAPRFSSLAMDEEPRRGFPFKAVAVAMVLVSLVLFGYSWYRGRNTNPPANEAPAAIMQPQPTAPAPNSPAQNSAEVSPSGDSDSSAAAAADSSASQEVPAPSTSSPKPSKTAVEDKPPASVTAPDTTTDVALPPAPLVVEGGKLHSSRPSQKEETQVNPPSLDAVANAAQPGLGGVVSPAALAIPKLAAAVPQRIKVSQGVTQGLLIRQVTPQYPSMARQMRVEGDVLLEAVIGREGTVRDLKVISGPAMLVSSAIQAVRQWRYKPYLLNGQPVEVETQIKLQFRL
ncbi:MAG TPA: TonB family protein [Terriglobales bacterium]|nr:TonB family protein [Terriglobales bacterium]